jgi:polyphosphate kinase
VGVIYGNKEFINREISWLEFNKRVLELSLNEEFSLLERIKFCSIFESNLDEFFMVRVASIMDQIKAKYIERDISGLTPKEQYILIGKKVRQLIKKKELIVENIIASELANEDIVFLDEKNISKDQYDYIKEIFDNDIFPVLTPIALELNSPFPLISNSSLNILVMLKDGNAKKYATVQVPSVLNRLIEVPSDNFKTYIRLEDTINLFMSHLFGGIEVLLTAIYRVTRNADLTIHEEEAEDLLLVIENSLEKRKWGKIIRLEVSENIDKKLLKLLIKFMHLSEEKIYKLSTYIDSSFLDELSEDKELDYLNSNYRNCEPLKKHIAKSIFSEIKKSDVFVNHPYDSFDIVTRFIEEASSDESVLAIKQTLYRVGGDSPIIKELTNAAKSGKQVTVLVELMARFDERNNINWAKELEQNGCHVIYGIFGLKTHSKITLVVRREGKNLKRYVHIGTGNYNDQTAKIYSDMGIFTANDDFGSDASELFNRLSGYSSAYDFKKMSIAPKHLRSKFISLIDREIENAKEGKKSFIKAKMNSLVDKEIIEKLYDAARHGVEIDLNVRGICCLKPNQTQGVNNINVISIVGKELEHSRIFVFSNDDNPEVYLSSADWMPRNLDRRTEVMFPIEDETIKLRIILTLNLYLIDNTHSYVLASNGKYEKKESLDAQEINAQKILSEISYSNNMEFIDQLESIIIGVKKIEDNK